jgi:glycosyltransferase involved in cell wall biosynthesis
MNADTARPTLSPLHRFWRLLPADRRRRAFTRVTTLLAPRPDRPPPPVRAGIAIVGELSRPSGLGEAARQMQAACTALGVPSWGIDTETGAVPDLPDGAALLIHVNPPVLPYTLLRLPRRLLRGRRVIGYWAWELPTLPPAWRPGPGFVHEVWALSHFTGQAIATILPPGMTLRVVPIPLAPPLRSGLRRADFGLPEKAVIVLVSFSLASSFARKNPLGAIAAFRAAFGTASDRILLLKVGNPEHFPADFAAIHAAIAGAPNIRLETRTLPAADSHALTACADIVLSLHRAEGFGLVPAEAMLLGIPVVATGWSGNMDFMDATSAALVPFTLVAATDPRGVFEAEGARWAEPDLPAAAAHLVRLAGDPAARAALGASGRAMAQARLGLAPVRAALAGIGLAA